MAGGAEGSAARPTGAARRAFGGGITVGQSLWPLPYQSRPSFPRATLSRRSTHDARLALAGGAAGEGRGRVALLKSVGGTRLELVTSTMSTWRSNQLS